MGLPKGYIVVRQAMPEMVDYDGPIWPWLEALVRRRLWNGISLEGLHLLYIPLTAYNEIRRECRELTRDFPVRRGK